MSVADGLSEMDIESSRYMLAGGPPAGEGISAAETIVQQAAATAELLQQSLASAHQLDWTLDQLVGLLA